MIKRFLLAAGLILVAAASVSAQDTTAVQAADDEIDNILDYRAANLPAPDFTLKDIADIPVSLSSFQGKWVVLDFWGAWCRWCIKGIPEMKEAYSKYHSKGLEIIGIDCGDTRVEWIEALGKYELPWINLYDPDARSSAILQAYNVQGFPTKVIINPEGNIYEVVIGEDPAFYQILENIFTTPSNR